MIRLLIELLNGYTQSRELTENVINVVASPLSLNSTKKFHIQTMSSLAFVYSALFCFFFLFGSMSRALSVCCGVF